MRAIRFDGKHVTLAPDAPEPDAAPGEAIVRITRAGIGEADLAAARGLLPGAPSILGHELVGVVERIEPAPGRERDLALVGQRVASSIEVACGRCDLCKRGLSHHCRDMALVGLVRRDGCLADRIALPVRCLAPLPASVTDDAAVFALSAAAALHAATIVRLEGRGFITVLGDSVAALLAVQAMARLNATVRLLGQNPDRFTRAERWNIKHRHIDEVGRRQDQDVVVDCTGAAWGIQAALGLVRPRGTVILGATPVPLPGEPAAPIDLSPIARHEIELVGARSGKVQDAVVALSEGRLDVLGLITKRFRLSDGIASLRAAAEPEQVKVVVEI